MFDRGNGTVMIDSVVAESLNQVLAKQPNLPRITMHGMRHTLATLAPEGGLIPDVVQERLGQANVQMTLVRYSHVPPQSKQTPHR